MGKIVIVFIVLIVMFDFTSCNSNKLSLPKFIGKECYYSDGIQDNTDFCKYYYDKESIQYFREDSTFGKVDAVDIENIKSYSKEFESDIKNQDFNQQYDFDYESQVKEGDYYYLYSKDGSREDDYLLYDEYDYYDLYYVDMKKCILYFFTQISDA